MKLVLAIIQPFKLDDVARRLTVIPEFPGMTVGAVRGFGREHADPALKSIYELEDFTDKIQIETVVSDDQLAAVIEAIGAAAHTGQYGDGMIFVIPVERSLRIASLTRSSGKP